MFSEAVLEDTLLWVECSVATQSVAFNLFRKFLLAATTCFSLLLWLGHSGVASRPHVAHGPPFEQV